MTSRTPPAPTRSTRGAMVRSSGPMPSMGASRPPSTWYMPRYSPERSMAPMSDASSTTQMSVASRRGPARLLGRLLEQMIREAQGRLAPDGGEARQLGDEIVDGRHVRTEAGTAG